MTQSITVSAFRAEQKWTLAQMGERLGLSPSHLHEIERTERASVRVALAIEALSQGRIDAGALCEEVRLSRQAVHGAASAIPSATPSTGQADAMSGEVVA